MLVWLTYVLRRQGGKKQLSVYNYTNKHRIRTVIVMIITTIINQYTYIARIT